MLELTDVHAGYGPIDVLHGISLTVPEDAVFAVMGHNGAGKTTLLRAIAGQIPSTGLIQLSGMPIGGLSPDRLVRRGLSLVPQGRGTLTALTVEENLRVGAVSRRDRVAVAADLRHWYEVFPRLAERRRQIAGTLSGGEQQMLAVARALLSRPRLLLCDEASLGLAPMVTRDIFDRLKEANAANGVALLLVEQNAALAMSIADRVFVMETGRIAATGVTADFVDNDAIRRAYLGL